MGFLHVYTGNGKGKTTCAVGLAIRAVGAGIPVTIVQFDKGFDGTNEHYNERHVLRKLDGVQLFPYGLERMMPDGKFRFQNIDGDFEEAAAGLAKTRETLSDVPAEADQSGTRLLLILDEIITCVGTKLLQTEDVMGIVKQFKSATADIELVMTGRNAWQELIDAADLVTEMTLVKHYWYEHQTPAREGIDY